jgi:glycosyltransferase involved in cell wall biosynthesis
MKLSVVCPTYNRASLLRECVTPLMELPAGTVEVVVVDDCSSDNTIEVCAQLTGEYGTELVRYFRLDRNAGAPAARNRGISEARGDCIMFVDSDDVPVPAGVAKLLSVLEAKPDVDFAYGKVLYTDGSLQPLPAHGAVGEVFADTAEEIGGYHWHTMGPVYRRSLIDRVGLWNTSLTGSQDWEYQARVKISGAHGEFVDTLVGYWRQHEGARVGTRSFRPDYLESVMKSAACVLREAERAGRADPALRLRLAKRLLVHAIEWGANGRKHDKRRCCRQAVEAAPGDAKVRMLGFVIANTPQFVDQWWCRRLERGRSGGAAEGQRSEDGDRRTVNR